MPGWVLGIDASAGVVPVVGVPGDVTTFAGSGVAGFLDAQGTAAQFYNIIDLAVGADGTVYASDYNNAAIRKITPGGLVSTLIADTAPFHVAYITVDADGYVYGLSNAFSSAGQVVKISPAGAIELWAGSTDGDSDGFRTAAQFRYVLDIDIDSGGNLYVTDYAASVGRIRKITPAGLVSTMVLPDPPLGPSDNFGQLPTLVIDHDNIYLHHQNAHTGDIDFIKITPSNVGTVIASLTAAGWPGIKNGIAIDRAGDIYLCLDGQFVSPATGKILKITPAGTVSVLTGGLAGNVDGSLADARFRSPTALAINRSGELYLTEQYSNTIRKIVIPGVLPDVIASMGPAGWWKLDELTGAVATDSSGNGHHGAYQAGVRLGDRVGPGGAYVNCVPASPAVVVPDSDAWSTPNDLTVISLVSFISALSGTTVASMMTAIKDGEWGDSQVFQGVDVYTQNTDSGFAEYRSRFQSLDILSGGAWHLVVARFPAADVAPTVEVDGVNIPGSTFGPGGTRQGNLSSPLLLGYGIVTMSGTPGPTRGRFLAHVAVFDRLLTSGESADLAAAVIADGWPDV